MSEGRRTSADGSGVIVEVAPPTRPDLGYLREQIVEARRLSDRILVPENQLGRASLSSLVVAAEVRRSGGEPIACLTARDRNVVGLERDLLTATALGVDHLLFVYGDEPERGERSGGLSVRRMLEVVRGASVRFRVGVGGTCARPLPAWKAAADDVFVQPCFDVGRLVAWREKIDEPLRIYPGVVVVGDPGTAARLNRTIPCLGMPPTAIERLDGDGRAGVEIAAEQIDLLRRSGAFDGVYLIPVGRQPDLAEHLAAQPETVGAD